MKTETRTLVEESIQTLEALRRHVYDYDYDKDTLWYITEALRTLKRI